MRRVILLLALLLAGPAMAQTEGVVVRTSLKPESGAVIGQHVRIFVDVLFPGEMPRPPRVALPDAAGAQILRYETQATTMGDAIDGKAYAGQRFEFALYARRGGTITVPAPVVTLLNAQDDVVGEVRGRPAELQITVPPGVDPARPVVATEKLTLQEQWTPAPAGAFKAGDALVRTVTRTAADVPGMAMLDLAFPAPQGVRVYVDPPQGSDSVDRGDVTGRRVDRVTYVFEAGGSFVIADVVQPWWDLAAGRLRRAEGRGVTVAVAAAPMKMKPIDRIERWAFVAVTALGLVAFTAWAWPRMRAWQVDRRARWLASEAKAFADLRTACRQGEANAVYRAFTVWRRRLPNPAEGLSLAEEIESALFAGAPWSGATAQAFARRAAAVRRHKDARPEAPVLPPLNPAVAGAAASTSHS